MPALAAQLGIGLLFLPSYSPELMLIERSWKVTKRCTLYGRYHSTFRGIRAAIPDALDALPTRYSQQPVLLMMLIFQRFDDVSGMDTRGLRSLTRIRKPLTAWELRAPATGPAKDASF